MLKNFLATQCQIRTIGSKTGILATTGQQRTAYYELLSMDPVLRLQHSPNTDTQLLSRSRRVENQYIPSNNGYPFRRGSTPLRRIRVAFPIAGYRRGYLAFIKLLKIGRPIIRFSSTCRRINRTAYFYSPEAFVVAGRGSHIRIKTEKVQPFVGRYKNLSCPMRFSSICRWIHRTAYFYTPEPLMVSGMGRHIRAKNK